MVKLTDNSIVYILGPSDIETGGIECTYSLFHAYKEKGINVKMVLIHPSVHPQKVPNWYEVINSTEHKNGINIPKAYSKYVTPEEITSTIIDSEDNLIIIPEIWPDVLDQFKYIQKSIWWLSVDNATGEDQKNFHTRLSEPQYLDVHHFYQSDYAYWFLLTNGAQYVYPLFDYINRDYIIDNLTYKNRDNVVLYNPKKGIDITQKLINENPDLKFIPLINMNRNQLKELMLKSKLYIDFGYHPGKDKFPREAVSCGCALITSYEGSAQFFRDVTIDSQYKFHDTVGVRKLIDDIFNNFEKHFNNFNLYRKLINNEVKVFNEQIENTYFKL